MTSRFKCRSFDTDAVTLDASFARLINVEVGMASICSFDEYMLSSKVVIFELLFRLADGGRTVSIRAR